MLGLQAKTKYFTKVLNPILKSNRCILGVKIKVRENCLMIQPLTIQQFKIILIIIHR